MVDMDAFKQEITASIAKITPPAGVSVWLTLGNHIDDWIKIATLTYIVVQITAVVVTKYFQWSGKLKQGEPDE